MADPGPDPVPGSASRDPEKSRRGRQLGVVALLAVVGAALAALAATLTWWSADYLDPLTGALTVEATGSATVPELIPLALVGLAGFGAALATRGVLRRIVGGVIALCGLGIAVSCGTSLGTAPGALVDQLTRPADLVSQADVQVLGPLMGLLGGLLLAAAGVLILLGRGARQQMGSRYERTTGPTPGTTALRTTAPGTAVLGTTAAANADATDDPSEWWKALDSGADPTISDSSAQDVTAPNSITTEQATPGTRPGDSTTRGGAESPPTVSEHTSGDGYHDPNASRSS